MRNDTRVDQREPLQSEPSSADESVPNRLDRLAVPLSLFTLYIIWGSTYFAIRIAVKTIPPFTMGGIRFVVAGSWLYLFLRWRGTPNPSLRQWGAAGIVGALLLAGGNGMVGFAEQSVASGLAAVLIATVPLWAALFAGIWGLWPRRLEAVGLALGFVGVVLLNTGAGLHGHPLAAGVLIFAALSWALGSVWSRSLPMPIGMMASAAEMLIGGSILLVMALIRGERLTHAPAPSSTWAFLYLIFFGSFVAFTAYNYLLQHVRPALATSYAYVNPVIAVLLGVLLGGEHIGGIELVGIAGVVGAVSLVIVGRQRTLTENQGASPARLR